MVLKTKVAQHIIEIVEKLQSAGYETYIVGGAVRDVMLGRTPKDYDLSTSATPYEIRQVFGRRKTFIIGRRFRIVHLHYGREIIEISTFRKEPPKDIQIESKKKLQRDLPEKLIFHDNEFGTSYEDAWRRDFTINALFYDPVQDEIIDHTGMGIQDLEARVVRAIGDPAHRFEEDPVRILRALKLVGQYGFELDESIKEALPATLELITHSSLSRLSLELEKILKNPYGNEILKAFHKYGFLGYFLPFLEDNWDTPETTEMLALWQLRNERIEQGQYRDSLSLLIAAIVLPYLKKQLAGPENQPFWENYTGIEYDIRDMIQNVFFPRTFCKRLAAASLKILLIQPKFLQKNGVQKLMRNPAYPHARELIGIQNKLFWHNDEIIDMWPIRKHSAKKKNRRYRNRPPKNNPI